eukprot:TRINITY_DN2387_c0_g1_i1.p1 TRINITY_DN2387_c0_g1~~TRINITY_DN2387_c0_g1_i1.p1  ORF type:complete len:330 (+),score=72.23 TRINITY_DN2387_c0_g1_i1:32-991(+)
MTSAAAADGLSPVAVLRAHLDAVTAVHVSVDETRLFSGDGAGSIKVWDLAARRVLSGASAHSNSVMRLCLLPSTGQLLSHGRDGDVHIFDPTQLQHSISTLHAGESGFCRAALCSTGEHSPCVAICSAEFHFQTDLWDLRTASVVCSLAPMSGDKTGLCMAVQRLSDSRLLTAHEDGIVRLWDVRNPTAALLQTQTQAGVHKEPPLSIATTEDNSRIITCGTDSTIAVWSVDVTAGAVSERHRVTLPKPGADEVVVRGDGKIFAVAGWDARVRLFAVKKARPLAILKHHTAGARCVAFGNTLLVSGASDHHIALWSVFT